MEAPPNGVRPVRSLFLPVVVRLRNFLLLLVLEFFLASFVEGRTLSAGSSPLPSVPVAGRCCLQVRRAPPLGSSAEGILESGNRRVPKFAFLPASPSSNKKCRISTWSCSSASRIRNSPQGNGGGSALNGIPHFYRWLCAQYPSIVKPLRRVLFRYPVSRTTEGPKISSKRAPGKLSGSSSPSGRCMNRATPLHVGATQNTLVQDQSKLIEQTLSNSEQAKILKRLEDEEERLLAQEGSSVLLRQHTEQGAQSPRHRQRGYKQPVPFLVGSSSSVTAVPVDALLVDFNAVIHLCTHGHLPSFLPSPLLQQQPQLLVRTCSYLDKLVKLIQPRKALVVTLDGVPPLAKLSQQRGRRFRHHVEQLRQQQEPFLQRLLAPRQNKNIKRRLQESAGCRAPQPLNNSPTPVAAPPPVAEATEDVLAQGSQEQEVGEDEGLPRGHEEGSGSRAARFDSNCIGPGTRFMFLVQQTLRRFISQKQRTSTTWRRMESVLLSGADCPGEGEHKLMRLLKMLSFDEYDPSLSDMWGAEMKNYECREASVKRVLRPARAKLLLPPAYTNEQSGPLGERSTARTVEGCRNIEGCDSNQKAMWSAHAQERHFLNEKGDQLLVPIPGRICLYGMDADLLILSLALHRPGVYILREKQRALSETRAETAKAALKKVEAKHNEAFAKAGVGEAQNGASASPPDSFHKSLLDQVSEMGLQLPGGSDFLHYKSADFELVDVDELRSQLTTTLQSAVRIEARRILRISEESKPALKHGCQNFPTEFVMLCSKCKAVPPGRLIDDFILLSFFVGNDFLPSLPHIDIFQGGLGSLIQVYTEALPRLGGPLTLKDKIHIPRLLRFFELLSVKEPIHFQVSEAPGPTADYAAKYYASKFPLRQLSEAELLSPREGKGTGGMAFAAFRKELCHRYISGLFFLLQYYHSNVPSWTWSFPYHYAPLASDLAAVRHDELRVSLPLSRPLSPYHQLLAVLPPSSSDLLPRAYQRVHDSCRSNVGGALKELHALFPNKFEIDPHPLEAIPYPGKSAELTGENLGSEDVGLQEASVPPVPCKKNQVPASLAACSKCDESDVRKTREVSASTRAELAIKKGKEALQLALGDQPRRGFSVLPEWLHRPLIPFVDLATLKSGAREAVDAEAAEAKKQRDVQMTRHTSDTVANTVSVWRPEDILRNRLGRTHIFVSPSLQQHRKRSTGSSAQKGMRSLELS